MKRECKGKTIYKTDVHQLNKTTFEEYKNGDRLFMIERPDANLTLPKVTSERDNKISICQSATV